MLVYLYTESKGANTNWEQGIEISLSKNMIKQGL